MALLVWVCVLVFVVTFALGSIPWGVIISRLAYKKDIRSEGSGNIGATNALRTLGKRGGASVFALDFGKGLLSGLFAFWIYTLNAFDMQDGQLVYNLFMAVGFAGCVWGHMFSPWLAFKGGKGIAVAVGYLFFLFGPIYTLVELGIFIVAVVITRYVSLGSVLAAVACPVIAFFLFEGYWVAFGIIVAVAFSIIWAHRGNIVRLAHGTESKIGSKKKDAA